MSNAHRQPWQGCGIVLATVVAVLLLAAALSSPARAQSEPEAARKAFDAALCSCTCGESGWACGSGAACYPGGSLGCVCEGFGRGEYLPSGTCFAAILTGSWTRSVLACPAYRPPTEAERTALAQRVQRLTSDQDQALWDMFKWDAITWSTEKADEAGKLAQLGLSIYAPSAWVARFGGAGMRIGKTMLALDTVRGAAEYRGAALEKGATEAEAAGCALLGGAAGALISVAGQNVPFLSAETDRLMRLGWRWLKQGQSNRRVIIGFLSYVGGTINTTLGQVTQEKLGEAAKSSFIGLLTFTPRPAPPPTRAKPVWLLETRGKW